MKELREWMESNKDSKGIIGFFFVLIMITGLYFSPPGATRWHAVGKITIFLLHIAIFWNVWWAIKGKERLHQKTYWFVLICLIYWGTIGLLFPNLAEKISVNTGLVVGGINEEFKPGTKNKAVGNAPAPTKEPTLQKLYLVPGENFRRAETPYGHTIIDKVTADCPASCIQQIDHDGDQICLENSDGGSEMDRTGKRWYWGTYQNTNCIFSIVSGSTGTIRYREQFLLRSKKIDFPVNLINVIHSFGTNPELGPVIAKVRVASR